MARISQICSGVHKSGERLKTLVALFGLLTILDTYILTKQEVAKGGNGKISLLAYKGIFKKEFEEDDEFKLINPLGDWLCSLPKGIWDNK